MRVAVVGASGFIGRAVVNVLGAQGHDVRPVYGLRASGGIDVAGNAVFDSLGLDRVSAALTGCQAVVNAAGDPDASSTDLAALRLANAILPGMLAHVLADRGEGRLVHVSSAVVQGRAAVLTASEETDPFSPYARSKIEGEQMVTTLLPHRSIVYRPPSVHAPDRRVSRSVARLAHSPLRSVAAPGNLPSPQALVQNVASAIAFLATCEEDPPNVVIHPSEGMTTGQLLSVLGGRQPHVVPEVLARAMVRMLERLGRHSGLLAANARRVEMMWFGQAQEQSWLSTAGWQAPVGIEGWEDLRMRIINGPGERREANRS